MSIQGRDLRCEGNIQCLIEGHFWKDILNFSCGNIVLVHAVFIRLLRAALLLLLLCHHVDADMKPLPLSTSSTQGQHIDLDKSARHCPKIGATAATSSFLQMPRCLFAEPGVRVQQRFTRIWYLSGSQFCQKLREKGIAISDWRPAAFGRSKVYECIFEASYPVSGTFASQALFLIVRGGADGKITSVRVKISFVDTDIQMRLLPETANVLYQLLSMQNWFDRKMIMRDVEAARELRKDEFGASINFFREKINKNNFNLRITVKKMNL